MFNEVSKKLGLMDKMYFGTREVKAVTQPEVAVVEEGVEKIVPHEEVLLEYGDDKLPRFEAVSEKEWELGKSEKAVETPDEYQKWSVKRLLPLREGIIKAFQVFNPRVKDIRGTLDWVEHGFKLATNSALDKIFACDFMTECTVDMALKKVEEAGEDPYKGLTELEKDVMGVFRKHGVIAAHTTDGAIYRQIAQNLADAINYGAELAIGSSDECRRLNDIEDVLMKYAKQEAEAAPASAEAGTGSTSVEGDAPKQDAGAVEDGTGSKAEPAQ